MAKTYSFLPDFSVFENEATNEIATEDTNSSIMSRNSRPDTGTGGDFLERFYRNLRTAFKDDDKFKETFMPNKRPKPNRSEIEAYINKSTRAKGIEDALFDATGTYKTGTPSDAGIMPLEDASDGITVPKQPEIQVKELSSAGSKGSIGEYLRTRKNKGSSFVGEGVEVADTSKLTTEQIDLAKRLAAKRRMEADAAQMNVPVADMEEEERKALDFAKTIPKLSTLKGEGIMSPKKEEPEVEAAEEITPVVEAEVESVEETTAGKAPSISYVNPEASTKGTTERKIYQYAYEQGLQGDELRAFMSQTAKESANFGTIKEYGYLKTKVNGSLVERTPAQIAAKLGGSAERKAAFNALANNKAFTEGTDAQKNKMIFDIYYDDQYRGEGYKLGNTEVGDGNKYRGRGYIQLTGKNNYRDIGKDIGLDLVANPDLMLDPEVAKKASVAWWKRNVRSKEPNYTDTKQITKLVNGGDAGLKERRKLFNTYKFAVGPQTSLRPSARPDTRVASN